MCHVLHDASIQPSRTTIKFLQNIPLWNDFVNQKTKGNLLALAWRKIAFLRTI